MVAIYARQSVDKKDSISIETQIDKCIKELDNEDYKVYVDKGYSGKNIDRPQFLQLIKDIEMGLISKVVVYKIDRISRAIIDFANISELFKKHNVEFISRTEKFDTSTPMGTAMLNIIMVFAQLERETIQLRIKDNYYSRGQQGFYLGGFAPYGYIKTSTTYKEKKTYTFIENEEQSKVVKDIYDYYVNKNMSLGEISKYFNTSTDIRTNRNNLWSGVSLGRLLRNPVYVQANAEVYVYLKNKGAIMNNDISEYIGENGCYHYGERSKITKSKFTDLTNSYITLGLHKGIIPADLWLSAQYKLDNNKQIKNSGKGTHSWLSGLLKCGYCGYAINIVNNNRKNTYINCGGRKLKVCFERKKVIHPIDIEQVVENQLLTYVEQIKYNEIKEDQSNNTELNQLNIKLIQIDEKINNLITKLASSNEVVMDYINKEITKLDMEKKEVVNKISLLNNKSNKTQYKYIKFDNFSKEWKHYSFDEKKKIAKIFIDKVVVTDDEIKVYFN